MARGYASSTNVSINRRFACRRPRATRRAWSSTSAYSTICSTASRSSGRARPHACGRTEKSARRGSTDRSRVIMDGLAVDAATAEARIAALEAALATERSALAEAREQVAKLVDERARLIEERELLRASHERLRLELELLRRRIFLAKAERVDST